MFLNVEHDLRKHKTDPKGNLKNLKGSLVYLKIYMGNLICIINPTFTILNEKSKLANSIKHFELKRVDFSHCTLYSWKSLNHSAKNVQTDTLLIQSHLDHHFFLHF